MKYEVKNFDNKKVGEMDLSPEIFSLPTRADILARMVNWQLAKRRSGNHATKGVSDISGTTKKPWRQKGTGRARAGSLRSPQFRGGAVIFGPVVRDHGFKLPKKVRQLALKTALSTKVANGSLLVVEDLNAGTAKTKELLKKFETLGLKSALIIGGEEVNSDFAKAAANIPGVDVLPQQGINVYDILRREHLVLTKAAIENLESRLK
ncbi:50S ribosomal protein L4 [Candidatus Bealeia paramacronuclearis]|uniref:Large ribosomal subunit protein uL4 n=1 Tax=Candidatus Bealeia paramacronuclearis TaxID=1921001 RepID=A0ABZ2C5L5_9PROT|nr:50S ribosomal protein L4 [Candidatus Bealeia paramacronuclearis]